MLKASDFKDSEPVYTHVDNSGVNTHISPEHLRKFVLTNPREIFSVPINWDIALRFIFEGAVSPERIKELAQRDPSTFTPIIFCKDGKFTNNRPDVFLVDGHHRYYIAAFRGEPFIDAYVLEESDWRQFQIEGFPDITQKQLRDHPFRKRDY